MVNALDRVNRLLLAIDEEKEPMFDKAIKKSCDRLAERIKKYAAKEEWARISKPFKTKEQAEKARSKYPERERKTIGVGVIRTKG